MAIGLDFSMVKKSGLFLVPVTDDHVKYADLFRALIEVAQARPKPSEAGMLISFALAGYFLVAMFSYDALDPSWSHSGSNTEIANFGGTAGAWMADLLFYLFGFLAFLLPIMLIYNGMILVKTRELSAEDQYHMLIIRWSGFVLTLVSGCALSSLHFSVEPGTMPLDAGGILGQITGNYFSQGLGFVGATVMHLALFLAGLTLFTGLSWLALIDNTGKYTLLLLDKLLDRYYLMRGAARAEPARREGKADPAVQSERQGQGHDSAAGAARQAQAQGRRLQQVGAGSHVAAARAQAARFRDRDRGRIGAPGAGDHAFRDPAGARGQGQPDFKPGQGPGAFAVGDRRARGRDHPRQVGHGARDSEREPRAGGVERNRAVESFRPGRVAVNPGAGQGYQRRGDGCRPGPDAAPAGSRHHRFG
jgi:DNA segregation ATPase FtsK/SpoIIIE-like protein